MENLPTIFETGLFIALIIMLVLAVVATGRVIMFKLRDRRATRLIRERLWRFVRFPWLAADLYYRDCDSNTRAEFNPHVCIDIFVDPSIPKSGNGWTWATALKDPKEAFELCRKNKQS